MSHVLKLLLLVIRRAVTVDAMIGRGVNIYIIMFTYRKNNRFQKKSVGGAEHKYMNIQVPPPPPPIIASSYDPLVTVLALF
jgi:hypothetical protein